MISRLLRQAMTGKPDSSIPAEAKAGGFKPFPARGSVVSNELIDKLRDSEGV